MMSECDSTQAAQRAAENLPILLGEPDFRLGETLKPITIEPQALAGTAPVFWACDLFEIRNIAIPVSHAAPGLIAFHAQRGKLLINLSGVQGYAFYIEVGVTTPKPITRMHWDTAMGGEPVHGYMTREKPGKRLHYFATPFASQNETSVIQISQADVEGAPDEHWSLDQVCLLGFRRT